MARDPIWGFETNLVDKSDTNVSANFTRKLKVDMHLTYFH